MGDVRALSQSSPTREDGSNAGRGERRETYPRVGRRLASAIVQGVWFPLRSPGRSLRGGASDYRPAPARGEGRFSGAILPGSVRDGSSRAPPARSSDSYRRLSTKDAATRREVRRQLAW